MLSCAAVVMAAALPHGQGRPLAPSIVSPSDPYPNFDIRDYEDDPLLAGSQALAAYMAAFAPASTATADALARSANGLAALRDGLPGIAVEADALGGAAVVSAMPGSPFLSAASDDRVGTLRAFLQAHAAAYGIAGDDAASLVVVADEMNHAGNMAWVELEQHLYGIPVFQGYLRGAFTANGELARTNGLLATGIAGLAPQATDLSATQAVAIAAANVGLPTADLREASREGNIVRFARGAMAAEPDARLVYFPLAPGVVRLAWQTEVFGDPLAFMTVVDAATGTIVFRKSLTEFQTQSATYNVYTSDSPAPLTPGPLSPLTGTQAPYVGRVNATLIGNEAPNTFNNNGWITDGNNTTDGNNVEAGVDRDTTNGVDAPVAGSPSRTFTATYSPGTDDPTTAGHQRGSVIDMFYWVNRYHDETYRLGFTEAFRNFQANNFGRGGTGSDRISAEGQDNTAAPGTACPAAPCFNNANFATPADGARGRMQMYLWNGPTPDLDGTIDHEIVIHELTHGLSNRLHGNASGLSTNMARGLGEGWSDFYARALLADATEPVNGIYAMGGWATHLATTGYQANYYYGIRRFPYAPISFTGGPGNRPHNPLTFADIDSTKANLTDGAFARGPFGSSTVDVVHNIGEVWASMLNEVRARFITRLGFAVGNQRILQYVTDGMKGDPVGPTLLTARDSIIAAANTSGASSADIADIWAGFAVRGLGLTASIQNAGPVSGGGNGSTRVTESFAQPVTTAQPATGLRVSSVVGNQVTLRWTPPVSGPAPTGYILEGGLTPGDVLAAIPLGPVPVFTFNAPTGAFVIRLRTVSGGSTSSASEEIPLLVNISAAPSAPANLLGLVNGSTLALSWRNTFGGGAPSGAIIDVTGAVSVSVPVGSSETFAFAGVPAGSYTFRVRTTNGAGSSPASNAVTLSFPGACSGVPAAPSNFLAYASGSTLNLVWESPVSGPAATSYVIGATGSISISVPVGGTSLSSPVPNGTYNLSIRAVNACGASAPTAVQTVTIP